METHEEAFLEDIVTHPGDDAPRLVFADWLDEHGEADRAEFIRLQCRHGQGGQGDRARLRREGDLLTRHEAAWRAELPALEGVTWEDFARGFVESVFVESVDVFLDQ